MRLKTNIMKIAKLLMFILLPLAVFSQQQVKVESKVSEATVFLNQAQITRNISTKIPAGSSQLVLKGLSAYLDPRSVQVAGTASIIITGVRHQQNYLSDHDMPKEVKTLRDSVDYYTSRIKESKDIVEVLAKEENMVISNQVIGGKDNNLTVTELSSMADFFRRRLLNIRKSKMAEASKSRGYNERLNIVRKQLNELQSFYRKNTSEVVVEVQSKLAGRVNLSVTYVVGNAGWQPVYDIRSEGVGTPMKINHKANVYQNTGVNWDNVKLKLSTTNPRLGSVKPELGNWYLDFPRPIVYNQSKGKAAGVKVESRVMAAEPMIEVADEDMLAKVVTTADYTQTVETTLATVFDISLPYSIASTGKPLAVDIQAHSIDAEYIYSVVPKLDRDAFLLAKIADWGEYDLMPGEANVFFEGTYVGKTYVNPGRSADTLSLSLGRDKRIVVEREKLKDFTSKKLVGTNKKESYSYEISVKNTRNRTIELIVEDQVPISSNSEIEVEILDAGGAVYDKIKGKLTWKLLLKPGESQKVRYLFEVKYPKNKTVTGL